MSVQQDSPRRIRSAATTAAAADGRSQVMTADTRAGEQEKTQIIYIRSAGHSGSTLLDMLISSHEMTVSVGEIKRLDQKASVKCTCGAPTLSTCAFWRNIDAYLRAHHNLSLDELDVNSNDAGVFHRHNDALFQAVRAVSGQRYIVDSSKSLRRLMRLFTIDSLDVRIVHLERHPFGVVYSNMKKGRDYRRYARGVMNAMTQSRLVLAPHPRVRVSYEALARQPEDTLRRVMAYIGLPYQRQQLRWAGRSRHNVGGNRMRRSSNSTIRIDTEWRRALSPMRRAEITLHCALGAAAGIFNFARFYLTHRFGGEELSDESE